MSSFHATNLGLYPPEAYIGRISDADHVGEIHVGGHDEDAVMINGAPLLIDSHGKRRG